MPYVFDFDSRARVLRCTFSGSVADDELRSYYRDAARYVKTTNAQVGILDLSHVASLDVSTTTVRELAASEPAMPDPSKRMFIVAPSAHLYGMARMYQLGGETTRPHLRVVRTLEEAYAAIELKEPDFQLLPDQ